MKYPKYSKMTKFLFYRYSPETPREGEPSEPRLAKCRQISIFAMPVAFSGKYWQIMGNTGKYDLQPLVISIIEVI